MRFLHTIFSLVAGLTCALANPLPKNDGIPARVCGTEGPSQNLRAAHNWLRVAEQEVEHGMRGANLSRVTGRSLITNTQPTIVDTWFHVVSTVANQNQVTDKMVRNQYTYLEQHYSNSGFAFRLNGADYTTNNAWAQGQDDVGMKTALRKGTYSTLNVYFQTDLTQPGTPSGSILLGFCTLPTSIGSVPVSAYVTDGCNILAGTMTSGPVYGYNLGGTAVHEVGHWLGLLHPFQDGTCDPTDPGDYVSDTPQESTATSGCPTGKDSCPNSPGLDPINNFMDYSTDVCYTGFTAGQNVRMVNLYALYRQGK